MGLALYRTNVSRLVRCPQCYPQACEGPCEFRSFICPEQRFPESKFGGRFTFASPASHRRSLTLAAMVHTRRSCNAVRDGAYVTGCG
jgi:hypothetical protein